jgi:excisionase family DNA binding protein
MYFSMFHRAAKQRGGVGPVPRSREARCPPEFRDRCTLTVQEVADILGISYERVRRAIHRGEIPALRSGPKTLQIPRAWLDREWSAVNGKWTNFRVDPLGGLRRDDDFLNVLLARLEQI